LRGAHRATAQPAAWQRKSAFLPEADIGSAGGYVGFVPISDIDHAWRLSQRGTVN
jgi:hypothetical protein